MSKYDDIARRYEKINQCDISAHVMQFGIDRTILDLEEWDKKHPALTYLQDFTKKFPDVPLGSTGTPQFCPGAVYQSATFPDSGCFKNGGEGCDAMSCWMRAIPMEG